MSTPSLLGRRLLLTRPRDRAKTLVARLEELGASVSCRPTIAFDAPRDPGPVDRALGSLGDYAWLVFTSATGVEYFADALSGREIPTRVTGRIAAVGPATAAALERRGFAVALVARRTHAAGLADELCPLLPAGARVLLVRPEAGRPELPAALAAAGARADSVAFYRTVASPEAPRAVDALLETAIDAVLFSSPSTYERLLEAAGSRREALVRRLGELAVIAIGEVTADALRDHAVVAASVAADPSAEGVVTAILRGLASRGKGARGTPGRA